MSEETSQSGDAKFGRILLKLSGEALMGEQAFGIDESVVSAVDFKYVPDDPSMN